MLPASNKGPSLNFGAPDVCLTPVGPVVVPIPYPNFGAHALAVPFSPIVKAAMIPALNLASVITLTTGDEPGVAHWTVMGPGTFDLGNPIVFIEKLPAINLTSQTAGNTMNDQPGMVVAPGAPNVLYTLAPESGRGEPPPSPSAHDRVSGSPVALSRLEGDVGYLRVAIFSLALRPAVSALLREWQSRTALSCLVLDLRDCPGGELLGAVQLLGELLPEGAVLAIARDAEGDDVVYRSHNPSPSAVPLVLLVNRSTASAAEVFAGALRWHGRALLVGERTYGKGAAHVYTSPGGAPALAATVLLPDGTAIDGEGVAPHVEVAAAAGVAPDLPPS